VNSSIPASNAAFVPGVTGGTSSAAVAGTTAAIVIDSGTSQVRTASRILSGVTSARRASQ
jgi:hypothetical protein